MVVAKTIHNGHDIDLMEQREPSFGKCAITGQRHYGIMKSNDRAGKYFIKVEIIRGSRVSYRYNGLERYVRRQKKLKRIWRSHKWKGALL